MPRLPQKLFIDTGAFLAWEMAHDQHHAVATAAWAILGDAAVRLVTSEHVLDEALTLLGRRSSYAHAAARGEDYLRSDSLTLLRATTDDLRAAAKAMKKFAGQAVSFTDCVSFVLMKREGIPGVFGFDRHFEAAGFRLWQG